MVCHCVCHSLPSVICWTKICKTPSEKSSHWPCNCFFKAGFQCCKKWLFSCVISVHLSVLPSLCSSAWNYLTPTRLIFMKFDIWVFFWKSAKKVQVSLILKGITGTLHEDVDTFMIVSHSVLRMRNAADRSWRENKNPHFMFNNFFFQNCVIHEIMRKNMVEPDRPEMAMHTPLMQDN